MVEAELPGVLDSGGMMTDRAHSEQAFGGFRRSVYQ